MEAILTTNVSDFMAMGFKLNRMVQFDYMRRFYNFELNKVYYMEMEGKLTAFKVLAISLLDHEYLVQFPSETRIVKHCSFGSKKFFNSKEHYFQYIEGLANSQIVKYVGLNVKDLKNVSFREENSQCVTLFNRYKWHDASSKPFKCSSHVNYMILTENGVVISYKPLEDTFATYQECVKNHIDGMVVEEFQEETTNITITITKETKPKIYTLNFIENF